MKIIHEIWFDLHKEWCLENEVESRLVESDMEYMDVQKEVLEHAIEMSRKYGIELPITEDETMKKKYNVFTYGTLMYPDMWNRVVGRDTVKSVKALLLGYKAKNLKGVEFPGLIADPNGKTIGIMYKDCTDEDLENLDSYESEGSLYFRMPVKVNVENKMEDAFVYLFNADLKDMILNSNWVKKETNI